MLVSGIDMAETPDEVLRALTDPERLAIAGALARADASGRALADDRATYRLDPETLR